MVHTISTYQVRLTLEIRLEAFLYGKRGEFNNAAALTDGSVVLVHCS